MAELPEKIEIKDGYLAVPIKGNEHYTHRHYLSDEETKALAHRYNIHKRLVTALEVAIAGPPCLDDMKALLKEAQDG